MDISTNTLSQVRSSQPTIYVPFSDAQLLALAPLELPSYRAVRYQADDVCVALDTFIVNDQDALRQVYACMGELLDLTRSLLPTLASYTEALNTIRDFARRRNWRDIIALVRLLGTSSDTWQPTEAVRKVLHDIKGGCFVTVSLILQLIDLGLAQEDDVQRLFFAIRDYRKIMRSSVRDLDPPGYEQDRIYKTHSARLLVEKWQKALYRMPTSFTTIELDCRFTGDICERCLEFAALDRILYNLVNNAAKNTQDGTIYITMLPLPEDQPVNVRFVISNQIMDEHQRVLRGRYGGRLENLFLGGFTTGGTGLGMYICGDLVAKAYGLSTVEQGVADGYIGATCIDNYFVNWFHWPVVMD